MIVVPTVVFLVLLSVYVCYVHPSLPGGDAGELMAACVSLSVPHPPGYPLFTLGCHGFSIGARYAFETIEVTSSVNLFSAVVSAAAGAMVASCIEALCLGEAVFMGTQRPQVSKATKAFKSIRLDASKIRAARLRESVWVPVPILSIGLGILFGLMDVNFKYATELEVFGLNNLFVAALARLWVHSETNLNHVGVWEWGRWVVLASMAMCHQHAILFVALPIALRVLIVYASRIGMVATLLRASVSLLVACLLTGALYATLMQQLDSAHRDSWGEDGAFDTPHGLLHHFTRGDYGSWQLHSGRGNHTQLLSNDVFWARNIVCWNWLLDNVPAAKVVVPMGLLPTIGYLGNLHSTLRTPSPSRSPVSAIGAVSFWGSVSCLASVLGFNALSNLDLTTPIHQHVVYRFWMQSLVPLWLATACGAIFVVREMVSFTSFRRGANQAAVMVLIVVSAGCFQQFCLRQAAYNSSEACNNGCSMNRVLGNYASSLLSDLPKGSLLITVGDQHLTAIRYAQTVLSLRGDVMHVDFELAHYPWHRRRVSSHLGGATIPSPAHPNHGFVATLASLCTAMAVPVFLLEDNSFLSSAREDWRHNFVPVYGHPSRWLYRLLPKPVSPTALTSICFSSTSIQPSQVVVPQFEGCFTNISSVSANRPWEAAVGLHYGLSKKNLLLQEAVRLQNKCPTTNESYQWTYSSLLESMTRNCTPGMIGKDTWFSTCKPFLDALERVIDEPHAP